MQLFLTDYSIQDETIVITEERVVHQIKNVLRAKVWYTFMVQVKNTIAESWDDVCYIDRYTCETISIEKEKIITKYREKKNIPYTLQYKKLFVALPNKFEKLELMVQKITELWLQHICFFVSQYSQIHDISDNKMQRLEKIAMEAVEQSYGLYVPSICFEKNIEKNILQIDDTIDVEKFILHQDWKNIWEIKNIIQDMWEKKEKYFFVWPEWWRWERDENIFNNHIVHKISLWKNILRTETAAIVMAWELVK